MTNIDNLNKRLDQLQKKVEESGRIITTSEASINQVAIEVKVMKIGNKQVTLAVFKQLPEEQIIDFNTGTLIGQPWGRVNYHPDTECKDAVPHFHIVWQKGNILYRAMIENCWVRSLPDGLEYNGPNPASEMDYYAELFLFARLLEGWLPPEKQRQPRHHYVYIEIEGHRYSHDLNGSSTLFDEAVKGLREFNQQKERYERYESACQKDPTAWPATYIEREREAYQDKHQKVKDLSQQIVNKLQETGCPTTSQELYQRYLVPSYHNLLRFRETWQQSYTQLEQLDQLFIAV